MVRHIVKRWGFSCLFLAFCTIVYAGNSRYRIMWRTNPSTSMVVGWDQYAGSSPVLYYSTTDHGRNPGAYEYQRAPDRVSRNKGMNNHFVRLENLKPNTVYYFVIKDSDGISPRFSFQTIPDNPNEKLSIIAGGDSRNNRDARVAANKLVSKLRPHFVLFAGDMIDEDTASDWKDWLDDWQSTIGSDGRLFPIVPALGNHEFSPKTLIDIFDLQHPTAYYAMNFGGNLLRVYTLNSNTSPLGDQKKWLETDLFNNHRKVQWRFAQYHHTIKPHTSGKPPREELMTWARIFHLYKVQLVLESDAHVVKWTYPIRPFNGAGSDNGFIRDDQEGTVYIGEGCWGAPLRSGDKKYRWTRANDAFNQFKWIFVRKNKVEIRTIRTDGSDRVREIDHNDIFSIPIGLSVWDPPGGSKIVINRNVPAAPSPENRIVEFEKASATPEKAGVKVKWITRQPLPSGSFKIERRSGQRAYASLGTMTVKEAQKIFEFIDTSPPDGDVSYRINCILPSKKTVSIETGCRVKVQEKKPPRPTIKIAPDPRSRLLTFPYTLPRAEKVKFIVVDANGTVVYNPAPFQESSGKHMGKIDFSPYQEQEYQLIVKAGTELLVKYKIINR